MKTSLIRLPVAPMHGAPSSRSEQVSQALLGDPAEVLEQRGPWRRIRAIDGYEGWVAGSALAAAPEGWGGETWEVLPLWANLRRLPSSKAAARLTAFAGTRLPLAERQEGWIGLRLPEGDVAWSEPHRVHPWPGEAEDLPPPEAVVETARRFLGVPYLWGGCTSLGLDCSGFVQLVWRLCGASLPRDAHQQAECGADVPPAEARAGDLLFFGGDTRPGITHVALCLSGGRMIHAAGSDGVRINARSDEPYGRRVVGARRVTRG